MLSQRARAVESNKSLRIICEYLGLQFGGHYSLPPLLERLDMCSRCLDSSQTDLGLRAGGSGNELGLQGDTAMRIPLFLHSWRLTYLSHLGDFY